MKKAAVSDREIRKKINVLRSNSYSGEHLRQVIRSAKEAFCEEEKNDILTGTEFLYQQAGYIRKRWWAMQGILLAVLWILLQYAAMGGHYVQRCMGIGAPLFVLLVVPEFWKNRTADAMEVEGAAYYSLRQIYSARLLLFAMVDLLMLSVFAMAVVGIGRISLREMAIQFLLPLVVTCCICFRTLYCKRAVSEEFSMLLCIAWSVLWHQFVVNGNLYEVIAVPVWYGALAVSLIYLLYCICRGQRTWREMWAENG